LLASRAFAIASSRTRLIGALRDRGWDVHVGAAADGSETRLLAAGAWFHPLDISRGGFSPWRDTRALVQMFRLVREVRPSLVHAFHAKPIILAAAATSYRQGIASVNTVTGRGDGLLRQNITGRLARAGLSLALRRGATVFQNEDDLRLFVDNRWVEAARARVIVGSGVELNQFTPPSHPPASPVVGFVARLLWDKGVREFADAAALVRRRHPNVRFILGGEFDFAHPNAVPREWVDARVQSGDIEFAGYVNDMPRFLAGLTTFVLPSYYGEGVPRVLLEAAATGVPVVTADSPGCREAVIDGRTGLLVPPRDATAVAHAVDRMIGGGCDLAEMRQAARMLAEERFDVREILRQTLDVYRAAGALRGDG
jgi:glycosyltransferase involved in cell wall biosynthesis